MVSYTNGFSVTSAHLCFVQEHWLFRDHLNVVRGKSPEFLFVGISGMNCDLWSSLWCVCSIFHRKSLSSCITPLDTNSDSFCDIKLCDLSGFSYLLICVYMPTDSGLEGPAGAGKTSPPWKTSS